MTWHTKKEKLYYIHAVLGIYAAQSNTYNRYPNFFLATLKY